MAAQRMVKTDAKKSLVGRIAAATAVALAVALPLGAVTRQSNAAESGKPNVLFIAIDDLNDWVGFLGGHPQARTPHMDGLARRGMVFANAHCAAPLCCPSRAALFSGRQPFRTGIYDNDANLRQQHPELILLPQYFSQQGYRTLGTGKLLHHRSDDLFDEAFSTEQRWSPLPSAKAAAYSPQELAAKASGLRHVVRYGKGEKEAILPLNRMPSDRNPAGPAGESFDWGPFEVDDDEMGDGNITTWAVERLGRKSEQPFVLCVGYYRPHIPLWAPRRYFELFPKESAVLPSVVERDLDDLGPIARRWALEPVTAGAHQTVIKHNQWKAAVAAYLACVAFVDAQIGRLLNALDAGPHADNTIVVLFSDHGWHLGEKQHWGKWTGWERSTRVPLVIAPCRSSSDFQAGQTCSQPVSLIDLYPTLAELCHLPQPAGLDGHSLRPLLADPTRGTPPVVTTFDEENYSVRTERWRLIRYRDGSEELYDHHADPHEWRNLAQEASLDAQRAELRSALPTMAAESRSAKK